MSNPCALPSLAAPPTEADLKGLPKLEERIRRRVGVCVTEYELIQEGDRILVGLSGGKDSWALLDVLESLRRRAQLKALVAELKQSIPDLKFSLLKAMKNVKTSHLLDKGLLALPREFAK